MTSALEHLKMVEEAYLSQEIKASSQSNSTSLSASSRQSLHQSSSGSFASALAASTSSLTAISSSSSTSQFSKKLEWCKKTLQAMT